MTVLHTDDPEEWLELDWQRHLGRRSGMIFVRNKIKYDEQATIKSEEGEFTASCHIVS